ncbi:PGN_0703 family putative restriction endonuclease, partial [Sphaerochaeta sp. PS]|uniref:PGN_0703 family putative restriction endonuclease n=1 Tax=Sphaerochaeta sp. PS TaxID=3076336 RepID=UPI0028A4BC15
QSSAALCINSFAPMKEKMREARFLNETHFSQARFEYKLPTGLGGTPPNLDFYLENSSHIIGVESKFLEILDSKRQKLDAYVREDNAKILQFYLPDGFMENVIQFYQRKQDLYHFDFSQMIKHTIGLLKRAQFEKKVPILLYIYWTPEDDQVTPQVYSQHLLELREFQSIIKPYMDFRVMKYEELWSDCHVAKTYARTLPKITDKYRFSVKEL